MNHGAILRGMCTPAKARTAGPRITCTPATAKARAGSIIRASARSSPSELGNPEFPLPNFVAVGGRGYGSGFLGTRHQPLIVNDPLRGVENLNPAVDGKQFDDRVGLLDELERAFHGDYKADAGKATTRRPISGPCS